MSTTILTDEQIQWIGSGARLSEYGGALAFARAIEQAVLQSPEVQAWKKDAERWKAWRKAIVEWDESFLDVYLNHDPFGAITEDAIDISVDAAMEKQP